MHPNILSKLILDILEEEFREVHGGRSKALYKGVYQPSQAEEDAIREKEIHKEMIRNPAYKHPDTVKRPESKNNMIMSSEKKKIKEEYYKIYGKYPLSKPPRGMKYDEYLRHIAKDIKLYKQKHKKVKKNFEIPNYKTIDKEREYELKEEIATLNRKMKTEIAKKNYAKRQKEHKKLKVYCGTKPPKKGYRYGDPQECKAKHQIRYYGIKQYHEKKKLTI